MPITTHAADWEQGAPHWRTQAPVWYQSERTLCGLLCRNAAVANTISSEPVTCPECVRIRTSSEDIKNGLMIWTVMQMTSI